MADLGTVPEDARAQQAPAPAPAVLSVLPTSAPAEIVRTEDGWDLDLGAVAAGTITRTLLFSIANDTSAGGAGTLSVSSDVSRDDAFRVIGAPNPPDYGSIGPGSGRGSVIVTFDTARLGRHEQTITLHPVSIAADGTSTQLPDQAVRVSMDVVGDLGGSGFIPLAAFAANLSAPDPSSLLSGSPVLVGGDHFARIMNLGSWSVGDSLGFDPSAEQVASYGPDYVFAVFRQVRVDLTAGGEAVDKAYVVGAMGGELSAGDGAQEVIWSFASGGESEGNTAAIVTGAGDDRITISAVGVDDEGPAGLLDSVVAPASILPYAIFPFSRARGDSAYEGFASGAVLRPGEGDDTVELHGTAAVTLEVAEGDGHDTVSGFTGGVDRIRISGVDPSAATASSTAVGGQSGTLLAYGQTGGSIFLAGVSALEDGDVVFVDVPPSGPGGTPGEEPPPTSRPGPVDWDALAAEVLANFEATGRWFVGEAQDPGSPPPPTGVGWDAVAAVVTANFGATGQWFA